MIWIAAHEDDEHGAAVGERLTELGADWLRIGARELAQHYLYSIDPLQPAFAAESLFARLDRRDGSGSPAAAAKAVSAIYWRRPYRIGEALMRRFPSAAELSEAEAMAVFKQAVSAFPEAVFPLGHPDAQRRAENKLLQLALAAKMGWRVPETVAGNDTRALRGLLERHETCVVKPLGHPIAYHAEDRGKIEHMLWCRGLPSRVLLDKLQGVQSAQMMVQQAVKKRADWRVTVLADAMVCCEIEASGLPAGELDWRKVVMTLPHRIIDMPADFAAQVRAFLSAIHLPAGCLDFAIDDAGQPWFLENNPNGQWLWIEQLTGHPISLHVAKALLREP